MDRTRATAPFLLAFTKREGKIKVKETTQITNAAVTSLSCVCTRHWITDRGWALQLCFSFSSLPEFWRSEDVDVADLSSKVIVLFVTLMYFIRSFRLAPGAKIHILQTVLFSAVCLPLVLFSAMLHLRHLSKFSQFCLRYLSSNDMVHII